MLMDSHAIDNAVIRKIFMMVNYIMYGGDPIIQQNVCGGDGSRASICIKILKYNTRFLYENVVDCSKILIYNSSSFRKL